MQIDDMQQIQVQQERLYEPQNSQVQQLNELIHNQEENAQNDSKEDV